MSSSSYPLPEAFVERMSMLLNASNQAGALEHLTGHQRVYFVLNPLKNDPNDTLKELKKLNMDLQAHQDIPLLGHLIWSIDHSFRETLTYHDTHTLGYFYPMGLPSILTVVALAPKPGELVLDLTAAPGGKTLLMSILMENTGQIIANDQSKPRFFKLKANLERLNVTNTTCYKTDGRRINKTFMNHFDKVLLDAPCSCESRFNIYHPKTLKYWGIQKIKACVSTQKQLMLNAFRACKPNGQIVYSTCTFAPEENEGIIHYLQKKHPNASLESLNFLVGNQGIDQWGKQKYPEGHQTLRIFPNQTHSGGCITKINHLPIESKT